MWRGGDVHLCDGHTVPSKPDIPLQDLGAHRPPARAQARTARGRSGVIFHSILFCVLLIFFFLLVIQTSDLAHDASGDSIDSAAAAAADARSLFQGSWPRTPVEIGGQDGSLGSKTFTPRSLAQFLLDVKPFELQSQKCREFHEIQPPRWSVKDPLRKICLDPLIEKRKRSEPCFAISIGIDFEWSFDDLMIEYGCTVYALDPSMGPNIGDR